MTAMSQYRTVDDILAAGGPFYVWMGSYVTHDRQMIISVHDGDFPRRVDLHVVGCAYWRGPTQGGPYHLVMTRRDVVEDGRAYVDVCLRDRDGQFELVCESMAVDRHWP